MVMKKTMTEVTVYDSDTGLICISQPVMCEDDAVILLHPSQIDLLIEWLKEAKKETEERNQTLPPITGQ